MTNIVIHTFSVKGEDALRTHWDEYKEMGLKQKMAFRALGYKQRILSEKPFSLLFSMNGHRSTDPDFINLTKKTISEALVKNGAKKGDFNIEVKEQ